MKQIRPGNYEYQGESQFLNACYEKGEGVQKTF